MALMVDIAGRKYEVEILCHEGGARIWINGVPYEAILEQCEDGTAQLTLNARKHLVYAAPHGDRSFVHAQGKTWEVHVPGPFHTAENQREGGGAIIAPMPGIAVDIRIKMGDRVSKGQTLLIIESMKMQTEILASCNGIVAEASITKGQSFERGSLLVRLTPEEEKCAA